MPSATRRSGRRRCDEAGGGAAIARRIPFSVLVVHLGTPDGEGRRRRQQPERGDPERRGDLPAGRAARRAGGARGDSERAVDAGGAGDDARAGSRRAERRRSASTSAMRSCGGDVPDAIETVAEHLIATHVHDNHRRNDEHLVPYLRRDRLGRGADVDAEDRLRGHVPDGAGQHRDPRPRCWSRRGGRGSGSKRR